MRRKRRSPAPAFRIPAPFNPATGEHAPLGRNVYPTRVAMMQVLVVYDDDLLCRGFDPDAGVFLNLVMVAKPLVLQKTPWDGKTYEISGVDVTFAYSDDTTRTLAYDGGDTITQTFSYPYFVGDVLAVAKPITRLGETPGAISESDSALLEAEIEIMYDSVGNPIAWMDLNVAGRGWVGNHQARWIEFVVNDGSGFATTDASVTVDGVTYHDGYEPGTAVTTVYNKSASSDYIFEGDDDDEGMALYDPDDDEYTICQMECA